MATLDSSQLTLPLGSARRAKTNGFARALAIVVRAGKQAELTHKATATCPRCGHQGPMHRDFGMRKINGRAQAQSWCRACRAARVRRRAQEALSWH